MMICGHSSQGHQQSCQVLRLRSVPNNKGACRVARNHHQAPGQPPRTAVGRAAQRLGDGSDKRAARRSRAASACSSSSMAKVTSAPTGRRRSRNACSGERSAHFGRRAGRRHRRRPPSDGRLTLRIAAHQAGQQGQRSLLSSRWPPACAPRGLITCQPSTCIAP